MLAIVNVAAECRNRKVVKKYYLKRVRLAFFFVRSLGARALVRPGVGLHFWPNFRPPMKQIVQHIINCLFNENERCFFGRVFKRPPLSLSFSHFSYLKFRDLFERRIIFAFATTNSPDNFLILRWCFGARRLSGEKWTFLEAFAARCHLPFNGNAHQLTNCPTALTQTLFRFTRATRHKTESPRCPFSGC